MQSNRLKNVKIEYYPHGDLTPCMCGMPKEKHRIKRQTYFYAAVANESIGKIEVKVCKGFKVDEVKLLEQQYKAILVKKYG